MACRACGVTSNLQNVLAEAIDRLAALRESGLARKHFLNEDDPDDLEGLAAVMLDIAGALDPLFHEIAYQGGLGSRSRASVHAAYVSNAVEGNLDFELRDRAERIRASRGTADPDEEHRLAGGSLGIGSRG
jgi:hypothetical protein